MSTPDTPAAAVPGTPPVTKEIRIYSHSGLYYWWPVWVFGFIFALWTLLEGHRLAILPSEAIVEREEKADDKGLIGVEARAKVPEDMLVRFTTVENDNAPRILRLKPRISIHAWMGPLYLTILSVVIIITNVPLRGLWSVVVIIGAVTTSLLLSLFNWWDTIFNALFGLHVYINMAGYLFISTIVCFFWFIAVFLFDKRSYIVFTPGQVKVCEQVGGREKVYDTTGMTIEKHRDDWFRHIFLGFGSGDLTVRTAGADRHEIVFPNVALIGFKIGPIEQMLRERTQSKGGAVV